jgi:hypothetical protein
MRNWLTSNRVEDLVYIYTNSKLLQERPDTNPTTWYKKNILFQNSMSNVDDNAYENNSSGEDPITSNSWMKMKSNITPFSFPYDDEFPCLRLLFN